MPEQTAIVLALVKNERNLELLTDLLQNEGYHVQMATTVTDFDHKIESTDDIGIAVLDIDGFTRTIWDRCDRLHEADIPTLVLTRTQPDKARREAFKRGVRAVLEKPVKKGELTATIQAW